MRSAVRRPVENVERLDDQPLAHLSAARRSSPKPVELIRSSVQRSGVRHYNCQWTTRPHARETEGREFALSKFD